MVAMILWWEHCILILDKHNEFKKSFIEWSIGDAFFTMNSQDIMVNIKTFSQFALSFEEAVEQPHFEKSSFRVNKKIFATLDLKKQQVVVKLSDVDQSVFCAFDSSIIYPVSGTWGKQGCTIIELKTVKLSMLKDALTISYCNVAPKRLSEKYNST